LLEDELLIVLDVESALKVPGGASVHPFSSNAEAVAWLATNTPDLAILDLEVSDGTCAEVARILVDRKIPFIVHTGVPRDEVEHDPVLAHGLWVSKPCPSEQLTWLVQEFSDPVHPPALHFMSAA
jgi:CheY-like chemotaxis protein